MESSVLILGWRHFALVAVVASCISSPVKGKEFSEALKQLRSATAGSTDQVESQKAWQHVTAEGSLEQLPQVLAAMKDAGPLAENWLRAAADTLLERELRLSGSLPAGDLEKLVLDANYAPRARRVAYEWLVKVDDAAPERILPQMLDDPSLELRYDAIEYLLAGAKVLDGEDDKRKTYFRALRSARDVGQVRACADALKELGETPNVADEMGFLTTWKVIGPFDNSDRAGFEKVYPPEEGVNLQGGYLGKNGPVEWIECKAEQEDFESLGNVDLNAALVEEKSVLAYAVATFVAKEAGPAECRYESKEATKLWVNGEEVAVKNVYHSGGGFDQYIVPCELKQGENQFLIKVCQNEQTEPWTKPWEFRLRVTDSLGGAIRQADK